MTTSLLYTDPLEAVCTRYSLPMAPLDTLAKRLLDHVAQMERDAAEAHSAAQALGVEVKDLADVAKTMAKNASAVDGRAELWHSAAKNLNADLRAVRRMVGASVTDDLQAHIHNFIRQHDTFQANAVDALDRLAKVEAKLQAINEALPPDLRHSDDLAAAVRSLVLTAETRYGELLELRRESAPNKHALLALRDALEGSRSLCLALARELYADDDNLIALLGDRISADDLAMTLMDTLRDASPAAPKLPAPPSPEAKAVAGPAIVGFFNHYQRPGRLEAIGGDLLRFHPVEGRPVAINVHRRELEVYTITPEELATEIARVEARKTPPAATPPDAPAPDVADDDLPF